MILWGVVLGVLGGVLLLCGLLAWAACVMAGRLDRDVRQMLDIDDDF